MALDRTLPPLSPAAIAALKDDLRAARGVLTSSDPAWDPHGLALAELTFHEVSVTGDATPLTIAQTFVDIVLARHGQTGPLAAGAHLAQARFQWITAKLRGASDAALSTAQETVDTGLAAPATDPLTTAELHLMAARILIDRAGLADALAVQFDLTHRAGAAIDAAAALCPPSDAPGLAAAIHEARAHIGTQIAYHLSDNAARAERLGEVAEDARTARDLFAPHLPDRAASLEALIASTERLRAAIRDSR